MGICMKKLIPLCIVGLFICSGLGAVATSADHTTVTSCTVRFSQPTLIQEKNFLTVSVNEADSTLMRQGKPMLPSYTKEFYFPFGTQVTSVTVTPAGIQSQPLTRLLAPTPPMVGMDLNTELGAASTVDYGTDPYPGTWSEYSVGCGRHNNALSIIVSVQVYPVQYDPSQNTITSAQEASIVVAYEPALPHPAPKTSYQLVIIGPSDFSGQASTLVNHKIGRGIPTIFVSLTDIYSGTYFPATGRDNQEKIKYFIKSAIESWGTSDVLLLGGSTKVPTRDTHVYISFDPDYGDEIFTSDLYYADIYDGSGGFCSWDSNGNNLFGEYDWNGKTDTVDLHPDVFLTRLAATGTTQVSNCISKIMTYENNPGYQQTWFPNLVVVGGDSFEDSGNVDEGEYANQKVIDVMTGFTPNKIWASNGKLSSLVPSGVANIKSAINSGCGFVDFNGHGNTNIWATHPHNDFNTWLPTPIGYFFSSDVLSLSNGDKLPIVTVEACSTAKFAEDDNCLNWAFMYNSGGGAIAAFGATGIGYSTPGSQCVNNVIGKMGMDTYRAYKIDKTTTLGDMWSKALNRYIHSSMDAEDYKTVEEWQPFGDPTLAIAGASDPPAKPSKPSGPASGNVGTEYTYTTSTTDPNGDQVYYLFDWADGTTSGWVGPFDSGAMGSAKKTWTQKGNYAITVIAKDTHGVLSPWSDPMSVTMPTETKYVFHPFLQFLENLLERFPNAFPFLRILLQ